MVNLTRVRNTIEMLDGLIENLTNSREAQTLALETLARQYHYLYPKVGDGVNNMEIFSVTQCTSCDLAFRSFEDTYVRFGTECSWCGPDAGVNLHVPNQWLDNMMKEDGDAPQG